MRETTALLDTRGLSTLDRLQSYASVNRTNRTPGLVKAAEDRACKLHTQTKFGTEASPLPTSSLLASPHLLHPQTHSQHTSPN
jgi:hypothetical protein